jgi:hypothetical protein
LKTGAFPHGIQKNLGKYPLLVPGIKIQQEEGVFPRKMDILRVGMAVAEAVIPGRRGCNEYLV